METKIIKGYAITFNEKNLIANSFYEVFDPHAFDGVDFKNVTLEYNLLDITRLCNLEINVDDKGVYFKCEVPQWVRKKTLGSAFKVKDECWSYKDDYPTRTITKIERLYAITVKS